MNTLINLLKKLYPNMLIEMKQRYSTLQSVDLFQPIGRRSLADNTKLTERTVRSEVEFLQKQGLIKVTSKGMLITKEGKLLLEQLTDVMSEIMGLSVLEKQLQKKLGLGEVIIVSGNSDEDEWVKHEMGKACVSVLKEVMKPGYTVAVTGGTTMAAIAKMMTPFNDEGDYLFVPARGGFGEKVENQANTIVAEMANKTNGKYRMLFVPDHLSETSYQSIIQEPSISEILQHIKGAEIVLHGVGDALTMALRRKDSEKVISKLKENAAESEAFGYYFDKFGNVIHKVRTVGIQLDDLSSKKYVITVAGGTSKGQAIASYFQQGKSDLLITDEAAAQQILRDLSL